MLMTVVTTSDPEAHVTVTGHVCVGGLSDSARGGWINAEQIINSESGADIMHPRPLPSTRGRDYHRILDRVKINQYMNQYTRGELIK